MIRSMDRSLPRPQTPAEEMGAQVPGARRPGTIPAIAPHQRGNAGRHEPAPHSQPLAKPACIGLALDGARAGDEAAFRVLYPGFSGDGDGFRGWVATIARHRAADHLRRARRRPQPATVTVADLETWAAGDDTADQALELMATEAAIALISQLPRDQAEAVLLRVVMGLDVVTTARVLDKRPGAVRMASYRGLRRLSGWLEQAAADSGGKAE